ncbi:MAG: hypothetical protein IT435_02400 [Phycisphaerales bacterium]|nr:hypothetical protein [Phycisphaerales bacterium]
MAFVFGTSTNYQTFADLLSDLAMGTSLQSVSAVAGGGTGYTVGDVLTISGGTSTVAATLEVLTAPAGVIGTVRVRNAGLYQTTPANNASVTGGTGTGATFTLTWGTNGWLRRRATNVTSAAQSATVAAGGTGYTVGDTLTVSGGTNTLAAQFKVATAPGGVVGTVTLYEPGNYTAAPSNPASTTGGTGTGCTLNLTFGGSGEREVILEGSGSGSDEIYVGYRTFFDSGSGARNICMNGFTGFNSALLYDNQPGRSPGLDTASSGPDSGGAYMLLTNSTITWWVSVTPRRIIAVAKTGTCYSSGHLGFLNPFATSGEWPYPLYVAGTTTDRFRLPSSTVISSSGISDPIAQSSTHAGPGLLRTADGQWRSAANGINLSPRAANTTGTVVFPTGQLNGVVRLSGDDWYTAAPTNRWTAYCPNAGDPGTQNNRLLRTTQSGGDYVVRIPCTLSGSDGTVPANIYGQIDGVFWFDAAATIVAENRFTDGSDRFTVFQAGVRSDNWALWALKES